MNAATDDGAATQTLYSPNSVTVTDPAAHSRAASSDALGRLTSVIEYQGTTNYQTTYAYNGLDDLTTATQGTLARQFAYNSLRQLVKATNPESGTICYGTMAGSACTENYDGNGNLLTKTDALGITTTLTYDAVNRILTKTYSDGTPTVTFQYDDSGVANSIGRLTSTITGPVAAPLTQTKITGYHERGWPVSSSQTIAANAPYFFIYGYNLAGGLTSEIYPSGRTISTPRDNLNRQSSVSGTLNSAQTSYANGVSWASHGALAGVNFGPPPSIVTQTIAFDADANTLRMQPTSVALAVNNQTVWSAAYSYCATGSSCSANNGNVLAQRIVTGSFDATQTYGYDGINRLTDASEIPTGGSTVNWAQHYVYDQWGNRALLTGTRYYIPNPSQTPQVAHATDAPPYANNQWLGATHAASGEMTAQNGVTYGYDAEKRLVSVTNEPNMPAIGYTYDGDGRRVTKAVGTAVTNYAYDANGDLVAEYAPETSQSTGTTFVIGDMLGSTRVLVTPSGTLQRTLDYLPFGEEIPNGVGTRGQPPYLTFGYPNASVDVIEQKFTGKERDAETGLDFFGARYMSSAQGRFTSPDEPFAGWDQHDPQSFSLYSYVQNNPLRYTDSDGHDVQVCTKEAGCVWLSDADYAKARAGNNPGVVAPGGARPNGDITCGGVVCGHAAYDGGAQSQTAQIGLLLLGGRAAPAVVKTSVSVVRRLTDEPEGVVIGKKTTLDQPGTIRPGDRELDLPNLNDPKANWTQNSSKLREAMSEGKPIRDASAEPLVNGRPANNTGFLRAERNLLENHGWTYSGGYWNPPVK